MVVEIAGLQMEVVVVATMRLSNVMKVASEKERYGEEVTPSH